MVMGSGVDWTNVLVALIAGLPAIIGAVFSAIVVLRTKTPSGDSIGKQVEQANHLAAANVGLTKQVHEIIVPDGADARDAVTDTHG